MTDQDTIERLLLLTADLIPPDAPDEVTRLLHRAAALLDDPHQPLRLDWLTAHEQYLGDEITRLSRQLIDNATAANTVSKQEYLTLGKRLEQRDRRCEELTKAVGELRAMNAHQFSQLQAVRNIVTPYSANEPATPPDEHMTRCNG